MSTYYLLYSYEEDIIEIIDPALTQVLEGLTYLDGDENTSYTLRFKEGKSLEIGGGENNQYKCNYRANGKLFELKQKGNNSDRLIPVVINDEEYNYKEKYLVDSSVLIEVVTYFFNSGEKLDIYEWCIDKSSGSY